MYTSELRHQNSTLFFHPMLLIDCGSPTTISISVPIAIPTTQLISNLIYHFSRALQLGLIIRTSPFNPCIVVATSIPLLDLGITAATPPSTIALVDEVPSCPSFRVYRPQLRRLNTATSKHERVWSAVVLDPEGMVTRILVFAFDKGRAGPSTGFSTFWPCQFVSIRMRDEVRSTVIASFLQGFRKAVNGRLWV